jgi:N,N'-diacetyllegionaminate synthase
VTLLVGGRVIGGHAPCLVVAEAGVNHNGDVGIAHRLVDAAAAAGADAVKFQTFDPSLLTSAAAAAAPYQVRRTGEDSQARMLAALTLPSSAWSELAAHARERRLVFLSTPFDLASAELLCALDVPAFKVPSGELNNLPFIRALAGRGLPLLISTGMGTLEEVAQALDAAAAAPGVALFHCVSAYPAPITEANLRVIPAMWERFGVPVGWSDHTRGEVTAVAAVALGAALLEKHLTLDRTMTGPDHAASADPDELSAYVAAVRATEAACGDGVKRPVPSEKENRRHALHAARDLDAGHVLAAADVITLRPAVGLPPGTLVDGLVLRRRLPAGAPITATDVVPGGVGREGDDR